MSEGIQFFAWSTLILATPAQPRRCRKTRHISIFLRDVIFIFSARVDGYALTATLCRTVSSCPPFPPSPGLFVSTPPDGRSMREPPTRLSPSLSTHISLLDLLVPATRFDTCHRSGSRIVTKEPRARLTFQMLHLSLRAANNEVEFLVVSVRRLVHGLRGDTGISFDDERILCPSDLSFGRSDIYR